MVENFSSFTKTKKSYDECSNMQKVKIQASGCLTEDEIEKMVKEAESKSEEDKKMLKHDCSKVS